MRWISSAGFACACFSALVAAAAPAQAGTYRQLYSFNGGYKPGDDGGWPLTGLVNAGGTLYGSNESYGVGGRGTVFSVNAATGAEQVIYSFQGTADAEGADSLISDGSMLYGTSSLGGAYSRGALFSLSLATGAEQVLHSFKRNGDHANEPTSLMRLSGNLYGTTYAGGSLYYGTIFKFTLETGAEKDVYAFQGGSDGSEPMGALIDVGGTLYGTTSAGSGWSDDCTANCATVYALNPKTGAETVLHTFGGGSDGAYPRSGLIYADGLLYGTTIQGGGSGACVGGCGTVFSIDLATGNEKVLHAFQGGRNGQQPIGGLTKLGGRLYGTTEYGGSKAHCGSSGCGTLFALNGNTGAFNIVHSFQGGSDGATPSAALINVGGTLYGTTEFGGSSGCESYGCGTVFAYTP